MKYIQTIWNVLNSKLFGYSIIILILIIFINTCSKNSNLRDDLKTKDYNISVLFDSIKTTKLKNGDFQTTIDGFIANEKELKLFNKDLADQVSKEKGKVISLNNLVFKLKQDTADLNKYLRESKTKIPPSQVNDSTWDINWNLSYVYDSNNYDNYMGNTRIKLYGNASLIKDIKVSHIQTNLLSRDSQMKITWGQKYVDGRLKIFAETSHPAYQAQLLEGVYLDAPKKKHWFTGFGVGPSINLGYNFIQGQPAFIIGGGIQYNVYQW